MTTGKAISTRSETPDSDSDDASSGIARGVIISFESLSLYDCSSESVQTPASSSSSSSRERINRAVSARSESPLASNVPEVDRLEGGVVISLDPHTTVKPQRQAQAKRSSSGDFKRSPAPSPSTTTGAGKGNGGKKKAEEGKQESGEDLKKKKEKKKKSGAEDLKKKKDKKKKSGADKVKEFNRHYCSFSKLENWQALCGDLGIEPVPTSLTQCRKALRKIWVNIPDFLAARESGTPQRFFPSQRALAKYTMKTGKIYPKKEAKKDGPLRELLARIV